jgi:predicted secreted protein
MVTVKCGTIINCPAVPTTIVSSEFVRFIDRPLISVTAPYRCDAQVNIQASINNAMLGEKYSYVFSSLETNPKTIISFQPASGELFAGDTTQNINTVAKFVGQSNIYCIKLVVTNTNTDTFEDYLLVQCATCT